MLYLDVRSSRLTITTDSSVTETTERPRQAPPAMREGAEAKSRFGDITSCCGQPCGGVQDRAAKPSEKKHLLSCMRAIGSGGGAGIARHSQPKAEAPCEGRCQGDGVGRVYGGKRRPVATVGSHAGNGEFEWDS